MANETEIRAVKYKNHHNDDFLLIFLTNFKEDYKVQFLVLSNTKDFTFKNISWDSRIIGFLPNWEVVGGLPARKVLTT